MLSRRMAVAAYEAYDEEEAIRDAAGSNTYPKPGSEFRIGDLIVLNGRPCKIVEMSRRGGRHGVARVHFVGEDIFTWKKYEGVSSVVFPTVPWCSVMHNMDVPLVKYKDYQLMPISDDGFVSLLNLDTYEEKVDVKLARGELGRQIRQAFETDENGILVTVGTAMGEEGIVAFKSMPSD